MPPDDSSPAVKPTLQGRRTAVLTALCGLLVIAGIWLVTRSTTGSGEAVRRDASEVGGLEDKSAQTDGAASVPTTVASKAGPPASSSTVAPSLSSDEYSYPSFVSQYELSTRADLRYAFLLRPLLGGDDISSWKLLTEARKQLGSVVGTVLDADTIANTITTSMPVEGSKPLKPLDDLVADCAKVLSIPKPDVFVRNDPVPNAYVTGTKDPHILVVTSGLLDLYDGAPEELRFVIGHELGHIKCDHVRMKTVGVALLMALRKINAKAVGDSQILPTLGLGRFLSWSREAEISADRSGLLCCQDPQVAFNAMARLLHGLPNDSGWIDPNALDFDADDIVDNFEEWENCPLVELLVHLKRYSATHPFIPERIAALKLWSDSGAADAVLKRDVARKGSQIVDIKLIVVTDIAGGAINPYLKVLDRNGDLQFETSIQSGKTSAAWKNFNEPFRTPMGAPIFVEIWNSVRLRDPLVGMFTIYPKSGQSEYVTQTLWDVNKRSPTTRVGLGKVKLSIFDEQ